METVADAAEVRKLTRSAERSSSRQAAVSPPTPHFAVWLVVISVSALLLHGGIAFVHFPQPAGDAAEYDRLAVNLVSGQGFALGESAETFRPTARRMPLYPLFLAGLYTMVGSDEGWVVVPIVQAVLMACSVALVIALARRFFGEASALWSGVLLCLYQTNLALPGELLSENLYLTLLLLTVFLFSWKGTGRPAVHVGAFAVLGLMILTRANALALVPVAYVWVWRVTKAPWRRRTMLLCTLCLGAVLTPWWVRNAVVFNSFIPLSTNGGWNFYLGHNEQYRHAPGLASGTDYGIFDALVAEGRSEVEADRELYHRGLAFAWTHPLETAGNVVRKVRVLFSTYWQFNWTMLILAAAGMGICCLASRPVAGSRAVSAGLLLTGGAAAAWTVQLMHMQFAGLGVTFEWIGPAAVLGMLVAFRRSGSHWLLLAVYLAQVAVALVFIPLVRIRWSVDAMAIMYAAVAVAAACTAVAEWLCAGGRRLRPHPRESRSP